MSPSRTAVLRVLALSAVVLAGTARTARAEWHFTPMMGFTTFGNTSLVDLEGATGKRHLHLGGSASLLGGGILGAEVLTLWTPGFFETGDLDLIVNSRTITAMGNVVITAPRRWTEYSLRPFISGGLGVMHAHVTSKADLLPISLNTVAVNIGGGAIGFLSERTGLRFDFRYHSTLNRLDDDDNPSLGPVHLRYVTASIGIVFRR